MSTNGKKGFHWVCLMHASTASSAATADSRTESVLIMNKMDINIFLHWGVRMKKCTRTRGRKEHPVASRGCIPGVHECPDLQKVCVGISSPETTIAAASIVCRSFSTHAVPHNLKYAHTVPTSSELDFISVLPFA